MTLDEIKQGHKRDYSLDYNDFTADEHHTILDREAALISLLDECQPIIHEYALINNRMSAQRLNDILESRGDVDEHI